MRVSVISDIHTEYADPPVLPGGDLLLIAGDTLTHRIIDPRFQDPDSRGARRRAQHFFRGQVQKKYKMAFIVMGNHDHWHGRFEDTDKLFRDFLAQNAPNTTLLEKQMAKIFGVTIMGTSLWAPCGVDTGLDWIIQNEMRDHRRIMTSIPPEWSPDYKSYTKERRWLPNDANLEHEKAKEWLEKAIPAEGPVILLTHHAPTLMSAHGEDWASAYLDGAYVSNLVPFFDRHPNIKLAVHGHTHHHEHYRAGAHGTLVVSNPRGYYPAERSAKFFDPQTEDFDLEDLLDGREGAADEGS